MLKRPRVETLLAVAAYAILAVIVTWPMVPHFGNRLYGAGGDDNWALISYVRALVDQHANPFGPGHLHAFAAPEGMTIEYPINILQWPFMVVMYALTAVM